VSTPSKSQPPEPLAIEDPAHVFAGQIQSHDFALRAYLRSRFSSIDADDVVQESYFRLLKAQAKRKIAFSKAYVFAIARNTARTLLHRQRIYSPTALADLPDSVVLDDKGDASDRVNEQLRFQLALEAIDRLPPRCRKVFRLAALDHLSTAEIARRTGLAENTVYAQLAIGVRKCSAFLRERGEAK